jgi:hypothetical protein
LATSSVDQDTSVPAKQRREEIMAARDAIKDAVQRLLPANTG